MLELDQLLITGTVTLAGPNGERIQVRGAGERIEADIARASLSLGLFSRLPSRSTRRRWLLAGQPVLRQAGLSIELLVDGRLIGVYDGQAKGSLLAHVLGLDPVNLKLLQLLLVWAVRW
ncbi:hypothetical protein CKO31_20655 [Thiohalocapsa halophila]|uniref:Uncharacterized protein n=2 Tax=Thiohalocapsa halophila TaxID=69359 RepID=A0ABS1CN48_9GAMM|nr:hypothetical protein [Thiohalocapsa halophila]